MVDALCLAQGDEGDAMPRSLVAFSMLKKPHVTDLGGKQSRCSRIVGGEGFEQEVAAPIFFHGHVDFDHRDAPFRGDRAIGWGSLLPMNICTLRLVHGTVKGEIAG
jgi:hypothetical protein